MKEEEFNEIYPVHMPPEGVYSFNDLIDRGVLWAINRMVFHPRGLALMVHFENNDADGPSELKGFSVVAVRSGEGIQMDERTEYEKRETFDGFVNHIHLLREHTELTRGTRDPFTIPDWEEFKS
jgi:hypothetical protein